MKAETKPGLRIQGVRPRLLLLLVALSLPLLIISLLQLNYYRSALNDKSATIANIEANTAALELSSWLAAHQAYRDQPGGLSLSHTLDLIQRLDQRLTSNPNMALMLFDAEGRAIGNPSKPGAVVANPVMTGGALKRRWSDGVLRMTSFRRLPSSGWGVVVGVPLDNSIAGYSLAALAVTWALVLLSSILLGVWAVGRFTKPLRHLAASASTLGIGKLDERAAIETDDEIGWLASDFNAMASQLECKFGELHEQNRFTEEVLDSLPLGVVVVESNLIVCKVNPTFSAFVGREPEKLRGRGLYEAAAGLAKLSDVVEDVRRTRKPFVSFGLPLELNARAEEKVADTERTRFWDVTIWPTTVSGARRGDLILVLSDVTQRVRAEKLSTAAFAAEKTRAAQLQGVINQMNEGVVIIDRQMQYKINPAAAKIIGRLSKDFPDGASALCEEMMLRDLNGDKLSAEETPFWRALKQREQIEGEQFKMVHADGQTRVVAISATPLNGEDGKHEGAVAVFRDITKEVQHRDELVAAYDRLRDHDRLKSAFVSNVTHELRTPLNVIIGLCQLLERDPQLPLAMLQRDAVQRMDRNARGLLEMVNELLEYSRLEAGRSALHLASVNVAELLNGVIAEYAVEARNKGLELRADVSPDLDKVLTDRGKLLQVLTSLIGNAVKFTATGAVVVKAEPGAGDQWILEVQDTGIGMPVDALDYIFDEFRQIDDRLTRSYGGTGLGLAITRKLVELLEGEITVESKPREGSRFTIVWPRRIRQHTGTGSLVDLKAKTADASSHLRLRAR
ncbi:MAG: ATP-binding protein [Pyrinomonadaceae bacterium]